MRGNTITIELPLKRGKATKTIPLYQYDYGQKLIITDADLPLYYEVHFSNEMHGEAVTSIGDSTGVAIPDQLLTTGENIYLWLYLHDAATDGETEFQGIIPVIKRAKATDQTPTPEEQSVITQAIAALNDAASIAAQAASDATAAQEHIENMGVDAYTLPTDSAPVVEKSVVGGEVLLTFGLPRGIKGDPGDPGTPGEPGNPGQDGEDGFSPIVSMSKEDGVVTLSITDVTGTTTQTISDGEPGDPTELIDDTAGAGDTDKVLSADKVTELLSAKYEKPGSGIPSTDLASAVQTSLGKADTAYQLPVSGIPGTDLASAVQTSLGKADTAYQKPVSGIPASDIEDGVIPDITELKEEIDKKAPVIVESASGTIASFSDGADGMPLQDCVVKIEPKQSGSGDPSPSNIRPITGWTVAKVTRTGVNLFGGTLMRDGIKAYMSTATIDDENKTISFAAAASVDTTARGITGTCGLSRKFKENTSYTFIITIKKTSGQTGSNLRIAYADGTYDAIPVVSATNTKETKVLVSNPNKTVYSLLKTNSSGTTVVYYDESGIFEGVLTASDFVPYVGTTYPVSWESEAGTVYGGTLDVTTGVLTREWSRVPLYNRTWTMESYTDKSVFSANAISEKASDYEYICSCYKPVKTYRSNLNDLEIGTYNSSNAMDRFCIRDDRYSNATDFKNYLTSIEAEAIYHRKAPVTYQLTPTEITSLLGANNIFADTGDTTVLYPADTKAYVDANAPTVTDVQVNGTSVLSNGVANIPIASSNSVGVVYVSGNGIALDTSTGRISTQRSTSAEIQTGTNTFKPIVPYTQNEAVFYGLAKASGDTSQASSSNEVGTYTPEALVKIQKMLGIYEAPWELIREDTFTNATEADHIISVDGNGQAFELTDAALWFETPLQETASEKGNYGILFYYDSSNYISTVSSSWTQSANGTPHGIIAMIEEKNGIVVCGATSPSESGGNTSTFRMKYATSGSPAENGLVATPSDFKINKINIRAVLGKGHYKLFGRRKWN